MVASDPAIVVLSAIEEKRSLADRAPLVVGIGGSVAVGKSTLAERVRDAAGRSGSQVTVIGTDGFLFPNSVLSERGLLDTKGAPNTYDEGALLDAVALLRRGSTELVVPVYSHRTFDVEAGESVVIGDVVIIEGVNALQPTLVGAYDLAIYLDADEPVVVGWFVERFLTMVRAAERDERSFYRRFVSLDHAGRESMALSVWTAINAPNLHQFVVPTRDHADLIVRLDDAHNVVTVTRPPSER